MSKLVNLGFGILLLFFACQEKKNTSDLSSEIPNKTMIVDNTSIVLDAEIVYDENSNLFSGQIKNKKDHNKFEFSLLNGKLHGIQKAWHTNGNLCYSYTCVNGKRENIYREFYPNDNFSLDVIETSIKPEIYIGEKLHIKEPQLFILGENLGDEVILYQNEPNPFIENTLIKFYLPEAQSMELEFYDAGGRIVHSVKQDLQNGMHSYKVSKKELGLPGILYYRLITDKISISKKMIIIE